MSTDYTRSYFSRVSFTNPSIDYADILKEEMTRMIVSPDNDFKKLHHNFYTRTCTVREDYSNSLPVSEISVKHSFPVFKSMDPWEKSAYTFVSRSSHYPTVPLPVPSYDPPSPPDDPQMSLF